MRKDVQHSRNQLNALLAQKAQEQQIQGTSMGESLEDFVQRVKVLIDSKKPQTQAIEQPAISIPQEFTSNIIIPTRKFNHRILQLQEQGIVIYHSTEDIKRTFAEKSRNQMVLNETDMERMKYLNPEEISEEMEQELVLLRNNTEGQLPSILMPLPKVVNVNGPKIIDFSMQNLANNWETLFVQNNPELWGLQINAPEVILKATCSHTLKAYSAGNIIDTKNRKFKHKNDTDENRLYNARLALHHEDENKRKDQCTIVEERIGKNCKSLPDRFLAEVIHHLITGERLVKYPDWMRVRNLTNDGDFLEMGSLGFRLRLDNFSGGVSNNNFGMGATKRFPKL